MGYKYISVYLDILQRVQDDGGLVQDNTDPGFENLAYLMDCVKEMANQDDYSQLLELSPTPAKLKDSKDEVQDLFEEVNLWGADSPRITYISQLLPRDFKILLVDLLQKYQDYFTWNYHVMLGLDRSLVKHHLPVKLGFILYE